MATEQYDPFVEFLRAGNETSPEEDLQFQQFLGNAPTPQFRGRAASTLGEEFSGAVESGIQGLAADLEYFKALGNTVIGDTKAAEINIREARLREEFAAAPLDGLETFEQFLDQPTFSGFISQATRGFGQIVPSAALSIASAGTGALAAVVGRGVLNQVNRQVAKRIIKDSVERSAKGVADPVEQQIAEIAYGSLRQAAKRGGVAGAFGAEFAPMSGSNLSEALDSGQPLDEASALRAAAVGVPQAVIGVGSEVALLKLLGRQATKRTAVEGSLFANFAKRFGAGGLKGGAIESTTELAQEGIAVANRADLDPLFTAQDAQLRLAEAAFVGFFGGAAPGAGGGAIGGALDAVQSPRLKNTVSNVIDRAKGLVEDAKSQFINNKINSEQFGEPSPGTTAAESQRDINAQLRAMFDDETGKNAVWIAGDKPEYGAVPGRIMQTNSLGGKTAYIAFVPGRGTIVSTYADLVDEVVKAGATDEALAVALGYSATKDYSAPGDQVVQVIDSDGNVVSEEVTNEQTLGAATAKAQQTFRSDKYRVNVTTVEKALEERRKRFMAEQKPEIRDMELFDQDGTEDQTDIDLFDQRSQTIEGQRNEIGVYNKKDPAVTFDNTAAARANYERVFGYTDWTSPRFASMNEQLLNTAANRQSNNPNVAVMIEDTPDGRFRLVEEEYGQEDKFKFEKIVKDKKTGRKSTQTLLLNLSDYLAESVRRAYRVAGDLVFGSKIEGDNRLARLSSELPKLRRDSQRVTVVFPNGKSVNVALWDLVNSGRGLLFGRGQSMLGFTDASGRTVSDSKAAATEGFSTLLADMLIQGYDVQVDGKSISNAIPDSALDVTAWLDGKRLVSLGELLQRAERLSSGKRLLLFRSEEEAGLYAGRLPLGPGEKRPTPFNVLRELTPSQLATQQRSYEGRGFATLVENEEDFDPDNAAPASTRQDDDVPDTSDARTAPSTIRPVEEPPLSAREQAKVSTAVTNMVREIIDDLLKTLNLKDPPRIYTFDQLSSMSQEQLEAEFPKGLALIRLSLNQMRDRPSKLGRHISGELGKVIIYRESGNTLQDALVVAHEIGHSLYKEERDKALTNKALRDRLIKAFKNSSSFKGLSEKYGFERGFEEWFSDQVALWANKRYRRQVKSQPKTLVERFFKEFVSRLEQLWRTTSASLRQRLGGKLGAVDQSFQEFMDAVLESRRTQVAENGLSFPERLFAYQLDDMTTNAGTSSFVQRLASGAQRAVRNPKLSPLLSIIRTADGIIRTFGNDVIADMFYVRPGTGSRLGFVQARTIAWNKLKNKFEKDVMSVQDARSNEDVWAEAASDAPTSTLSGRSLAIRKFLEDMHRDYITPSKTKIGFIANYYPRALNLQEIANRPQEFINLLVSSGVSRSKAERSVSSLTNIQTAIQNDIEPQADILEPSKRAVEALELTKNLTRDQLGDFLSPPEQSFWEYVRHTVKRVEFDRATLDDEGNSKLEAQLNTLNPEDKARVTELVEMYLGYRPPLSPHMRTLNSWGQLIQTVLILPFALIGSLTDLAGPLINSREFAAFGMALKELVSTFNNRQEALNFAKELGVITSESAANAYVSSSEMDFMTPQVRGYMDKFFEAIGLTWFTNFTRAFAANMGVQFLITHAQNTTNNPRSERYLAEFGVTRDEVMTWVNSGRPLTTPEGIKVAQAVTRFVESSTLRPNAAERPPWGSDPRWALVWQLKGYFYSVGKVIIGGIRREAIARGLLDPANSTADRNAQMLLMLALPLAATLPLAMLGMELREYAKYGLAWLLPGVDANQRFFRTDRMDWPEYLGEAFSRTGLTGPLAIVSSMNQSAEWGRNPVATALGPTAEMVDKMFGQGFTVDRTIKNVAPLYNIVM